MTDVPSANVFVGTPVTLATTLEVDGVPTPATGAVSCLVVDPLGGETLYDQEITNPDTGIYRLSIVTTIKGLWHWYWRVDGQATDQGSFTVEDEFDQAPGAPDLTDLAVLVPRSRRICEGPFGPPPNRPTLLDSTLYDMTADACADIILYSGQLFGHDLIVSRRDPLKGFPTGWRTSEMLTEWESAIVTTQVGLNYHMFALRDMKTSVAVQNEGTSYEYQMSANVLRDYLTELKTRRDLAMNALMAIHPIIDRYASNIRVRDQVTVSMLEWWDTNAPDQQIGGFGGGQWAVSAPWALGWGGR